jgi:hypothetical protein
MRNVDNIKTILFLWIVFLSISCSFDKSSKLKFLLNVPSSTVGGTVTGLTGTLVLQNNGKDNQSITANGSFTFATSISSGSTYSVTILTQPTGQSCAASNNTGTMGSANVTSVAITCSAVIPMLTIGGTLSQMGNGSTIVLQNNGADDLTVTANGSFTFKTGIASGATYSVTVLTQPTSQTCIVSNPTGTVSSANITDITVICTGNANGALSSGTIINTLSLTGGVTTFVGAPCAANASGCLSPNGHVDSTDPTLVRFNGAEGITTDGYNLYVADKGNNVIRKIVLATGATTTIAGSGARARTDGTGTSAAFYDPRYIVTDGVNIYVGDSQYNAIRRINIATTVVTTIYTSSSLLSDPKGMVIYNNNLYISDNSGNAIRQINLSTNVITTVISSGISSPGGMALNGTDIYISEKTSDRIYKTTIGTWTVSTFAGSSAGYTNGTGTAAQFFNSEGIITDGTNLYVADRSNDVIRKIVIATAEVTTLAGPAAPTITPGYTNSSTPSSARFDNPKGIVSDGANIYVFDTTNNTIRLIQ